MVKAQYNPSTGKAIYNPVTEKAQIAKPYCPYCPDETPSVVFVNVTGLTPCGCTLVSANYWEEWLEGGKPDPNKSVILYYKGFINLGIDYCVWRSEYIPVTWTLRQYLLSGGCDVEQWQDCSYLYLYYEILLKSGSISWFRIMLYIKPPPYECIVSPLFSKVYIPDFGCVAAESIGNVYQFCGHPNMWYGGQATIYEDCSILNDWAKDVDYEISEGVKNKDSCYYCFLAHKSDEQNEPGVGPNWLKYWYKI